MAAYRADVGLLTGECGGGGRVDPGLSQVEQAVVAGGAASGAADDPQLVVGNDGVGKGDVSGVGHHVGERHRAAGGHVRAGRGVGILAVDELDDVDTRGVAEVVARVGVGDDGAGRVVGILAGDRT